MPFVSQQSFAFRGCTQAIFIICGVFLSVASAKKAKLYSPNFSYQPKAESQQPTRITMAFLQPVWEHEAVRQAMMRKPFTRQFQEALVSSISELVTSKGLTVKGPFETHEEMTYADKKTSHIAMSPKIHVGFGCVRKSEMLKNVNCSISGSVVMRIMEPMSKELLWQKRIELKEQDFEAIEGNDANNKIAKHLESYFQNIMEYLDRHLDVSELNALKRQSIRLKKRKVY